jgi:rifampicin phosphotransferase
MNDELGTPLRFEPPDDGPWEFDASHFDAALPRYGAELFVEGFCRGQAESFEAVGIPMKGVRVELVHGLPYVQLVPLVGKASDAYRKPPPRWVLRLLSALHPTLRRRTRRMQSWIASRGWREDLRRWDEELKPGLIARLRELEATELECLANAELVAHVRQCDRAVIDDLVAHFFTNPATMLPVGLFLHRTLAWTECKPVEALALLEDAASRQQEAGPLEAWARAARGEPTVRHLLADSSIDAETRLATLCEHDVVGETTRAWYRTVAHRQITTGSVANPIGIEVPELLVNQLQHALDGERSSRQPVDVNAVRDRVPREHRERFDELLQEARLVYRLRDERSGLLDAWVFGLLRRALLEVGTRLVAAGRLHEREHVVDLETTELAPLLESAEGPGADEVAARVTARCALRVDLAPPILGADRPPPPPPAHLFGGAMADVLAAVMTYRELMEADAPPSQQPEPEVLEGLPASGGRYTGTARICTTREDFAEVRQGDILVARATMPAYNVLLPILGGIVTDRGGTLSHAAIVSREYGLPCVVGTRTATSRIRSGDTITVDGDAGRVLLEAPARPRLENAS